MLGQRNLPINHTGVAASVGASNQLLVELAVKFGPPAEFLVDREALLGPSLGVNLFLRNSS